MADIFARAKRSQIMSKIGHKDSKPELFIRKLIHSMGFRYRLHKKSLPGCPDLVFPKYRKVIFVNGCFWHGHPDCKKATLPSTNIEFWKDKIKQNVDRDSRNCQDLEKMGWNYLIIWQCEIKKKKIAILRDKITGFIL